MSVDTSMRWWASAMAFAIFLFILIFRLGDLERREFLYRLAHQSDFVSKFNCEGIEQNGMVGLFIGPEQRRVLLAPIIQESPIHRKETPELFRSVKIPEKFPIVECVTPQLEIADWLSEYNRYPYK